jgi:histidinol-phosphate phosphatase family protein
MDLVTKALILMGGFGAQFQPLSDVIPNCLVPVGGRSLLDFWLESLVEAGISGARINSQTHAERIRTHIRSNKADPRLCLVGSYETKSLGLAGTAAVNRDLADGAAEIVIINANSFSDVDLRPLIAFHRQHGDPVTVVLVRGLDSYACGTADLDAEGRVISFADKTKTSSDALAVAGLYVVDADAYREIATMGAQNTSVNVLPKFVGRMRGWVWGGSYLDVESQDTLERACHEIALIFPAPAVASSRSDRPAIFLDRDGTVIEHVHYLCDPALIQLLPGVAEALRRFRQAGFARIIVTNQSAIGRGMLTEQRLDEIHTEMNRQLAACGATIDAVYYCPDVPGSDDRTAVENPDRKPGPGMLLRAAADLKLDLAASWMIGDLISDVLAGHNAGCRSILLKSGQTSLAEAHSLGGQFLSAPDLAAAADLILATDGVGL